MKTLNRAAADLLRGREPNAVTDVTGFGLFGHALEVAERSRVQLVLDAERFPDLEGALEVARRGLRTGGDARNRDFTAGRITVDGVPPELELLGFDPQTSGGLLVSLPAAQGAVLDAEFRASGLDIARVGAVEEGAGVVVR